MKRLKSQHTYKNIFFNDIYKSITFNIFHVHFTLKFNENDKKYFTNFNYIYDYEWLYII